MAKDKKGFILYADQKSLFDVLNDNEAGMLIKHIFKYVNDENPTPLDRIIEISFEPIKMQLKRDLVKYEKIKDFRSEIGKIGGLKSGEARKQKKANEAKGLNLKQNEANEADNVNDNVNVIDIEKELTNSFSMIEKTSMLLRVKKEWTETMLKEFILEQNAKGALSGKTIEDARKHFVSWIKLQPKDIKPVNGPKYDRF